MLCIVDFVLVFNIGHSDQFYVNNISLKISEILLLIIIVLIFNFLRFSFVFCIWFGIKFGKKTVHKEKLNKDDVNNKEYFRNILKNYSLVELSYIDDIYNKYFIK